MSPFQGSRKGYRFCGPLR